MVLQRRLQEKAQRERETEGTDGNSLFKTTLTYDRVEKVGDFTLFYLGQRHIMTINYIKKEIKL